MFTGCFSICGHPSHSPRLSAIFLGISNILSSQGCVIDIFSWRSICRPFVIRYCIHFVLVFWVLSLIVFCYVHFLISLLSVTFCHSFKPSHVTRIHFFVHLSLLMIKDYAPYMSTRIFTQQLICIMHSANFVISPNISAVLLLEW